MSVEHENTLLALGVCIYDVARRLCALDVCSGIQHVRTKINYTLKDSVPITGRAGHRTGVRCLFASLFFHSLTQRSLRKDVL